MLKCTIACVYDRCKLLVIGGGSGGCTIAAKFARRLKLQEVCVLEPSTVRTFMYGDDGLRYKLNSLITEKRIYIINVCNNIFSRNCSNQS